MKPSGIVKIIWVKMKENVYLKSHFAYWITAKGGLKILFGYWLWAAKAYFCVEFVCYDKTLYHWNRIEKKVSICHQSAVIYTTEMGSKRFCKAHHINLNNHSNYVGKTFLVRRNGLPTTTYQLRNMVLFIWHVKFYLVFVRRVILCFISTSANKRYRNSKQMRFRRRLNGLGISTSLIK